MTTGCLLMISINPQNALIIVLLVAQIAAVLIIKPYKGDGAWIRPFLNLLMSALIQLVYLLDPMMSKSSSIYSAYAPFVVIALLVITLAYNAYFYIKNLLGQQ